MKELSKEELLELLYHYDRYIQQANDDDTYQTGWYPVCIEEFYNNDYQLLLEEEDNE